MAQTVDAILLVGAQDHLGVRGGAEAPAAGFQLASQLTEVVDLAIEDHGDPGALVRHRLIAGYQVDDCQTPVPEADRPAAEKSVSVGATVRENSGHRSQRMPADTVADSQDVCGRC